MLSLYKVDPRIFFCAQNSWTSDKSEITVQCIRLQCAIFDRNKWQQPTWRLWELYKHNRMSIFIAWSFTLIYCSSLFHGIRRRSSWFAQFNFKFMAKIFEHVLSVYLVLHSETSFLCHWIFLKQYFLTCSDRYPKEGQQNGLTVCTGLVKL